MEYNAIRF